MSNVTKGAVGVGIALLLVGTRPASAADLPSLGEACQGDTIVITMPPGRPLDSAKTYLAYFSRCAPAAAPGKVVPGGLRVKVPDNAQTGPVFVVEESWYDKAHSAALAQCATNVRGINSLQSACAPDLLGLLSGGGKPLGNPLGGPLGNPLGSPLGKPVVDPRGFAGGGVCKMTPGAIASIVQATQLACAMPVCPTYGPVGTLTVYGKPVLHIGVDDIGDRTGVTSAEAELGSHLLSWRAESPKPVTSAKLGWAGTTTTITPAAGQLAQGDRQITLGNKIGTATLEATSQCGTSKASLTLRPVLTVGVEFPNKPVAAGQPTTFSFVTSRQAPDVITLHPTFDSPAFTISSPTVKILPGKDRATATVTFDSTKRPLATRLTVTAAPTNISDLQIVAPTLQTVVGTIPPGELMTTATGTISYSDPGSAKTFPVRLASVDIVDDSGELIGTGATALDGTFSIKVEPRANPVHARLCARAGQLQVNLEHDLSAPLCLSVGSVLEKPDKAPFGAILLKANTVVDGNTITDQQVQSFNALDVLVGGDRFIEAALPGIRHGTVRLIPKTTQPDGSNYGVTIERPMWSSDIWIPWNLMGRDDLILHEYGHHVEQMLGTYVAWANSSDGCYVTTFPVDVCHPNAAEASSVSDPKLGMFEGFADFLSDSVLRFGNSPRWSLMTETALMDYAPGGVAIAGHVRPPNRGCACPLEIPRGSDNTQLSAYVAGALMSIANLPPTVGGVPMTNTATVGAIFETLRDAAGPSPLGPPTYRRFRSAWMARFPAYPLATADGSFKM